MQPNFSPPGLRILRLNFQCDKVQNHYIMPLDWKLSVDLGIKIMEFSSWGEMVGEQARNNRSRSGCCLFPKGSIWVPGQGQGPGWGVWKRFHSFMSHTRSCWWNQGLASGLGFLGSQWPRTDQKSRGNLSLWSRPSSFCWERGFPHTPFPRNKNRDTWRLKD